MTYTNPTIRKKLGELGFFEVRNYRMGPNTVESAWRRTGGQMVRLVENNFQPPVLFTVDGNSLDIDSIPVLNPNLQTPDPTRPI